VKNNPPATNQASAPAGSLDRISPDAAMASHPINRYSPAVTQRGARMTTSLTPAPMNASAQTIAGKPRRQNPVR
jgi:hypothetical protein